MAKKKKDELAESPIEKKIKKKGKERTYNTFQICLIVILATVVLILSSVFAIKEVNNYFDSKELMSEFNEYYESDDLAIIFYNSSECVFCEMQRPILEQIAKDYDLKYLDFDKLSVSQSKREEIQKKLKIDGSTPSTVVVQNGQVIATQNGYVEGNRYVEFFVKAGVLPEGSFYKPEQYLTFIDYDEFVKLKDLEEPTVVVLGASNCNYCTTARPILSNLSNAYDIQINYLNLSYISKEEYYNLIDDLKELNFDDDNFKEKGSLVTPTLLIIKDSEIIDYMTTLGNVSLYTKMFKDNGIIKD